MRTAGSDTPARALIQASLTASGTMVGVGSCTLWPSALSHRSPSPVEPVSGCDVPPVATMYEAAKNSF